jgi:hypothetical protein
MKNFRLFIIALALVTFFSACKKDDAPIKPKTTAEKISSTSGKKWTISSVTAKFTISGQQREQDVRSIYFPQACQRDNIMVLYSDKKIETREGNLKCGSSDVVSSGTWELKNSDKEMHITSNGNAIFFNLIEANETTIKTEFPETFTLDGGGTVEGTVSFVYTAQ